MGTVNVHVATVGAGQVEALIWLRFGATEHSYSTTLICIKADNEGECRPSLEFGTDDFAAIREATLLAQKKIDELIKLDESEDVTDECSV